MSSPVSATEARASARIAELVSAGSLEISPRELHRLGEALRGSRYLDATRDVLQKHGSLWFLDESYVVSRKRD